MQQQLTTWDYRKTRYVLFALLAMYLLLFLPFWKQVLLGFLFAAACAPLVNKIRDRLHTRRTRVAYLMVTAGLVFLIVLIGVVALQIYSQLYDLFENKESVMSLNDKVAAFRDQILEWTSKQSYLANFNVKAQFDRAVVGITNSVRGLSLAAAQGFVANAPETLLKLIIFLMSYAAFMVSLPRIWTGLCRLLNLEDRGEKHFRKFEAICSLALGSVLITGLIQSVLVVVGSAIAGFGGLMLIFAITFVCSMIPVVGAGSVPFVLALTCFFQGETSHGVIMLVTGAIVGVSDNIIRAYLFSRAAESNPAISIITLIGGITLLGFPGLFVAPVLEQLVMTYVFGGGKDTSPLEEKVPERRSSSGFMPAPGPTVP